VGEKIKYDEFVKRFTDVVIKHASQPVDPDLYAYAAHEATFYMNYRSSSTPEDLAWEFLSIGDEN